VSVQSYPSKRAVDLVCAGAACFVFAPVVTGIALAVWLEDRGSPLFGQLRVGETRREFRILKFRSMRDGHVTRVGRWLRRTGLDELPQFANVCLGDMSVVGPRPLTAEDVGRLSWTSAQHDWRFSAKPGITGLAQLLGGRGARHSARLDRLYLRRQSLVLDVQLVALSFVANIVGKAAARGLRRAPRRAYSSKSYTERAATNPVDAYQKVP
jgi:undecaprenyl phosphate N,N'-diacetylbacillosamine 1-phosphate transferase